MHLLIDLDHTIISSLPLTEATRQADSAGPKVPTPEERQMLALAFPEHLLIDGTYVTYERPHLQTFLDQIFLEHDVSVCTAASQRYALEIIEKVLMRERPGLPERRLKHVFWNSHGGASAEACSGNRKCIKYLRKYIRTNERIILLDDTPNWAVGQQDDVIIVPPFNVGKKLAEGEEGILELVNDTFLIDLDLEDFDDVYEAEA